MALIDTGVVPVQGLDGAGKVVNGPDLSFDSQTDSIVHLDAFGHGTHMAGIIAGSDGPLPSQGQTDDSVSQGWRPEPTSST